MVFKWALGHIEPDKREEWVRMLDEPIGGPPPGKKPEPSPEELRKDAEAFMALYSNKG